MIFKTLNENLHYVTVMGTLTKTCLTVREREGGVGGKSLIKSKRSSQATICSWCLCQLIGPPLPQL